MQFIPGKLKNSHGAIMVIAICILLAVTAVGLGMVTNAFMSSTIAKNYKNRIQSFYASDGVMTTLAQAVIDSTEYNWTGGGGGGGSPTCGAACTLLIISSATATASPAPLQPASNAVDKNAGTRWESVQGATADPSFIYVDLGSNMCVKTVVMTWENANAQNYTIDGSTDAATWTTLATKTGMPLGARTDSIYGLSGQYRYVRMNGTARNTAYGYSIYEFRVYGTTPAGGGGGGGGSSDTLWPLVSATASSGTAGLAIDKNTGTRWESAYSDPQWIYVATDSNRSVDIVVLDWESASAANYTIQGSTDAATWTTLATQTGMTSIQHRIDSISGLSGTYKYIRMNGTARTTIYGYSIWEFRVYGPKAAATLAMDTVPMGDYKVVWSIKTKTGCSNCLNLQTRAFKLNVTMGVVFQTPINQYIERQGGGFFTPLDTVWRHVTYYDFHQDRTCPEFEAPHWAGQYGNGCGGNYCLNNSPCPSGNPAGSGNCIPPTNLWVNNSFKHMVATKLDSDHKPWFDPATCHCHLNAYIKYWFRDWNDSKGGKGDLTVPNYPFRRHFHQPPYDSQTFSCAPTQWCAKNISNELGQNDSTYLPVVNVGHDTSFKNKVIQDSVPFVWNATKKVHVLDHTGWYPLDGKGFGDTTWNTTCGSRCSVATWCGNANVYIIKPNCTAPYHNYGWTMELQTTIVIQPNQWFTFHGDDDLWLFINDSLVLDLGGCHNSSGDSINTNNLTWLQNNQTYRFSLFYCERHSDQQNVHIETNMLQYMSITTKQRAWHRDYGSLD